MTYRRKKLITRCVAACILACLIALFVSGFDCRLETTYYDYTSDRLPAAFNGYRIVLLSDFHLKEFGNHEEKLISRVEQCNPDIIVMTGDVVDSDHDDITPLEDLLKGIADIVPVYYVTGNHDVDEDAADMYEQMEQLYDEYGVTDLDDRSVTINRGKTSFVLTGSRWRSRWVVDYLKPADTGRFNILLYHGSDYFPELKKFGYDLMLSGHSHGGIIRLPFVGGVFANDGSLFPEYDGGYYIENGSAMISSRGLGDAKLPRYNNRPEVVCIRLHSGK